MSIDKNITNETSKANEEDGNEENTINHTKPQTYKKQKKRNHKKPGTSKTCGFTSSFWSEIDYEEKLLLEPPPPSPLPSQSSK